VHGSTLQSRDGSKMSNRRPSTRSAFDNDECHLTRFDQSPKQLIAGHTTNFNVTLATAHNDDSRLRPRATFSTSGSSYFHVPLTTSASEVTTLWRYTNLFIIIIIVVITVRHLYNDRPVALSKSMNAVISHCTVT